MSEKQRNELKDFFNTLYSNLPRDIYARLKDLESDLDILKKVVEILENDQIDRNAALAALKRESFTKISKRVSMRGVFTIGEWTTYLNNRGAVPLLDNLRRAADCLKEVQGGVRAADTIARIVQSSAFIYINNNAEQMKILKNLSPENFEREKFRRNVGALIELSGILKEINSFVPSGVSDYISYNLIILSHAKNMLEITEKYADKINELWSEIEKILNQNRKSQSIATGDSLSLKNVKDANFDPLLKYWERKK
ncbi:MAG: hypothetical protein IKA32_05435 [Lentisphaeria bacterium]|nr:hypothetical protein [Lentisphaeria bacterium]